MAEYIEREALSEYFREKFEYYKAESEIKMRGGYVYDEKMQYAAIVAKHFLDELKRTPAADVVEVVHGECPICSGRKDIKQDCDNGYYIEVDREQYEMSVWFGDECLAVFSIDFCPNCGAKMDGETNE